MDNVHFELLNSNNEKQFYDLAGEYLPGSSHEKMRKYAAVFPELFIALMLGSEVIGAAFGWHRKLEHHDDDSFVLDGIAIKHEYLRSGYGRQLLSAFEKAAKNYGGSAVSVGSAGGYVEKFYIACGYTPKEYKVWTNSTPEIEKTFDSLQDYYSYKRTDPDGFVVMAKEL